MKNARRSFDVADDKEICLEPKKTEEKRPVGRPRKYHKPENYELDINELHDFNDILKQALQSRGGEGLERTSASPFKCAFFENF